MRRADVGEGAGAVVGGVVRAAVAACVGAVALMLRLEMVGEDVGCADAARSVSDWFE